MNQEYYIQIMGRDAGPFTLEEMYQLIRQGTIQNTTQVRLQDQTQPAFAYTELRVLLELQTRPAPTVKSSVKPHRVRTSRITNDLWLTQTIPDGNPVL